LAIDAAARAYPSADFDRVALLRTIVAQRLQDLPMDEFALAIHAVQGIEGLMRLTMPEGRPDGDRRAAAGGSLILWHAGHREEATALAIYATREYERGETHFGSDDFPPAYEVLVTRGVRD